MIVTEEAPAKVNLVLHVGSPREDGLHPLCSLFASLDLVDEVSVEAAGAADEVICPGVEGPNLAAAALAAYRSAVPGALPAVRVTIEKRIPVAAGLGGGSADAAAVLRAANLLAGEPLEAEALRRVGAGVGSDVPSQVEPQGALVTGVGEGVEALRLPSLWLVLCPQPEGLSAAEVYARLDRLRAAGALPARDTLDPAPMRDLASGSAARVAAFMENDLEVPALSMRPGLAQVLADLRAAGAEGARVSGSGPTTFGAFADADAARRAASAIPGSVVAATR